jgi:polysaccharide biosynthesis transport protein
MHRHDGDITPYQSDHPEPAGHDRADDNLLQVIGRHRWALVLCIAAALAAAVAYLHQATPVYTAVARLHVQQIAPLIMTEHPGAARRDHHLATESQIIRSIPILEKAIREARAGEMKTFGHSEALALPTLLAGVGVEPGAKHELISVWFSSPHPEEATRMVDAILESYTAYQRERRRSLAQDMLAVLHRERDARAAERMRRQREMVEFQSANGTLSLEGDRGNVLLERLAQLADALTMAQRQRIDADAAYAAAEGAARDPDAMQWIIESRQSQASASIDREYGDLRARLHDLEMQLSATRQRMLPGHPLVNSTEQAVEHVRASLEEKQKRFASAYLLALDQQRRAARQAEQATQAAYEEQQRLMLGMNARAAEYANLRADLERLRTAADLVDARIKELSVQADAGALHIAIVEPAHIQAELTQPRRARVLGMGLGLGLVCGTLLALVRDRRDRVLRSGDEMKSLLGTPSLYVIPHIKGRQQARIVQLEPGSEAAEAYRILRTAISYSLRDASPKTLLVTSPERGDGKTTVATNLAIALAQAGHRTILVEADLRKAEMQRIFGFEAEDGLALVLAGQQKLQEAIRPSGIRRLDLLPCGPIPENPAELLNSPAFAATLDALAERYDYILLDSPPVLAVADAHILAPMCAGTLLVLRAGKSDREMSGETCQALLGFGARIVAVVGNDVAARYRRGSYGYYGQPRQANGNGRKQLPAPTHGGMRVKHH